MNLGADWAYINKIAQERYAGVKTKWSVVKYGDKLEIMGAAGEIAVRRLLRIDPRLHVGMDDGVDIIWRGHTIDVKTTTKFPRVELTMLRWPLTKSVKADIIVLVLFNEKEKEADIVGYIPGSEVTKGTINNKVDIPCYEIPATKFRCIYNLLDPDLFPKTPQGGEQGYPKVGCRKA